MLKLGSQGITAIYLGGQKITKAYLGEAVVFDTAGPPEPTTYTIALSVDPQGGGIVSGGGTVEGGAQVTVTAAPASGYTFSGWRESGSIVSTSRSYTFTVTSDRSLTAVFAAAVQSYSIVTSVDPAGAGTASGGGTYTHGQSVTLQATPASGYQFAAWREGGMNVSTDASYTFTASGNRTITAVFAAITYTVTTSTDPVGSGTTIITGTGTYQKGESVTVTASPDDGYKFVKWTENGQTVSESASYTFTVSGDRALVAVFEAEQTSRLPAGYTEVEYVQNGTSSNANYMPYISNIPGHSTATKLELQFSMDWKSGSNVLLPLFGQNRSSSSTIAYYFIGIYGGSSNSFMYQYGANNARKTVGTYSANNKHTLIVDWDQQIFKADDSSIAMTSKNKYIISAKSGLFIPVNASGAINIGSLVVPYRVRIYSLKKYDTSGNLLFELVPCINASGKIGFYDIVAGLFYQNSNTSTNAANVFIAGPAV